MIDETTRNSRALTQIMDVNRSAKTNEFVPVPDDYSESPSFGFKMIRTSPEKSHKSKI